MVIHAGGGTADVKVTEEYIEILLSDTGPGIKDVEQALSIIHISEPTRP